MEVHVQVPVQMREAEARRGERGELRLDFAPEPRRAGEVGGQSRGGAPRRPRSGVCHPRQGRRMTQSAPVFS